MTITLAILLSILLILSAAVLLLIYWMVVYRPHPRIEGRIRLPGLQRSVEVLRDRWGVPHLYAETEDDLWFAQGFVHAQDRLWQMEQTRRVAAGRISEAVGDQGVALDRFARIIGFRRIAENQLDQISAPARQMLERYAAGVNAFLAQQGSRLPIEFKLLGIRPAAWDVADSLGVGLLLGWALTGNWQEELARVAFHLRLGPERAAELLPDYPAENPAILPGTLTAELAQQLLAAYHAMQDYLGLTAPGQGSNNWVVNGTRTISGKPLLANDPHLSVSMPGIWHLAHLEAAAANVHLVGAGMPGLPGIMLGHNDHIAWGATAAFPDIADLFVERPHPTQPGLFQFGETWEAAEVREEQIMVRGAKQPVIQRVTITRHGPLITDFLQEHERNYPSLALCWSAAQGAPSVDGLRQIMLAANWEEFRRGAGQVAAPPMSFVFADRSDNIGYFAAGRVPIRAQGQGLVPAPGYSGTHEWLGFIPGEELPQSFNPDRGFLYSANHRIVPADYPHWWGIDHYPGYRARRIVELLESRPRLSARDFQSMQLDTYCYLARTLSPYFTLIDPKDPWERRAQKALLEWNYRMDADSMAALVFEFALYHLLDLVFVDKLGPEAQTYKGLARLRQLNGGAFSYQAVVKLTELLQNEESWWFGEGASGQSRTREELLALALKRAVASIKQDVSDDARRWQWGRQHQIAWMHPLGVIKPLRRFLNRGPYPVAGGAFTINAEHLEMALPFHTVVVAPTYRMVIDLANWDRSTFVACPGQSGLPGHRFYDNLMHIWLEGEMIPMSFSRAKVEESDPLYRLVLAP